MTKRLLSGIKPTGTIHIGNYFGAMRQFVALQDEYEAYIFIADLHALNQVYDAQVLRTGIQHILASYLAIGLDPAKVTLFQQSTVPAHAQLAVMLNSITSMGLLERAHAYKDAQAKGKAVNVGLFDYPVLMAADILLYQPDVVPVGQDQKQHVEIAADIAGRFNHLYGEFFKIPQPLIQQEVATVPGLDGRKMSKSYNNVIGLFDTEEVLRKKVMSITTDSRTPDEAKDPDTDTLFAFHRLFSQTELPDLEARYRKGGIGYKESKDILFKNMNSFLLPFREKYQVLLDKPEYLQSILEDGRKRAEKTASATLAEAMQRVGIA